MRDVARHLAGRTFLRPKTPEYGAAFEHLIFRELRSALDYGRVKSLHYWRSTSGFEVDFIVDERWAVEVKAAHTIRPEDLKGLKAIGQEGKKLALILVYGVERAQIIDGIDVLPWHEFLERIWAGAERP